ncbi:MAG: 2-oxoacid:ferredoxin oxidoreductase subunit beta [Thermoproteota archaeon]|nr:MAG: 2-oxoacid:ferredoxin oxidoreductase subunit beta [Candidatus Korarchaeota archaeon]
MLKQVQVEHPLDPLLRIDRIPHIWCPGCGIGIVLNAFLRALKELNFDMDRLVVVSGIGCAGRAAGYVNADGFHTTHGRPIPFATGVKLAKPYLKVVVFSGDGDLFAIGGNHFIHAARRNIDMLVLCVNNQNYGMTGGQLGPTTPLDARTSTSPYGNIEHPFNLVHLAAGAGAVYVARWTVLHVRRMTESIKKALLKKGFSFIEVISPCPTLFGRYNRMGTGLDMMKLLAERSVVMNFIDPAEAVVDLRDKIVCGEFVDTEKPEYTEMVYRLIREKSGREVTSIVES